LNRKLIERREKAAKTIQNYWRGTRIPYQWILFSGTAECVKTPNLEQLYNKELPKNVYEVTVRRGREIQAIHTREYGYKKDIQNPFFDALVYKGTTGTRAFAVMIYKSGKVTFTGGYPENAKSMYSAPRSILNSIVNVKNFKIVSSTIQLRTNLKLKKSWEDLQSFLSRAQYQFEYKPPEVVTSFISIKIPPETVRIFKNGQFQVTQVTSPQRAVRAIAKVREMIQGLVANGFYTQQDVPTKKRETVAQRRATGNIAPSVQQRSTTCPKDRRPTPYSFGGEPIGPGYYIGPNPQGLPCCYKIPKKIDYLRPKIIQRFAELGIRIPASTKKAFGIVLNNSNKPVNASNKEPESLPMFMDKGNLKIGTRQAKRWPLVKLIDIALKLGSTEIKRGMSKDSVIDIIEREARKKGLFGQQDVMRIEGKRNIRHFTKKNLVRRVLKVYGVRLDDQKNMKNLVANVSRLQKKAMIRRVFNEMVPSGPNINENIRKTLRNSALENMKNEKNLRATLRRELNQGLMDLIRRR
jgi:TATA-box binding protein (TBP) (component of TFIID and TFIIIB)